MLNKVTLIGNVGKDPEVKTISIDDTQVCRFSLATSERWQKHGEKREKTEWHDIVVWNEHLIGVIQKYVHKGDKLYLEGQLQTREWTTSGGETRKSTEVVLHRFKGEIVMLGSPQEKGSPERAQTLPEILGEALKKCGDEPSLPSLEGHEDDLEDPPF